MEAEQPFGERAARIVAEKGDEPRDEAARLDTVCDILLQLMVAPMPPVRMVDPPSERRAPEAPRVYTVSEEAFELPPMMTVAVARFAGERLQTVRRPDQQRAVGEREDEDVGTHDYFSGGGGLGLTYQVRRMQPVNKSRCRTSWQPQTLCGQPKSGLVLPSSIGQTLWTMETVAHACILPARNELGLRKLSP